MDEEEQVIEFLKQTKFGIAAYDGGELIHYVAYIQKPNILDLNSFQQEISDFIPDAEDLKYDFIYDYGEHLECLEFLGITLE